ncbi:HD-GYP domain-containing protein [Vibrio salinus]|uniref:HD-GYP domain-containing protein n=1 Tax=Vibrio salinus TaxID=2899784 RepID=UPI001E3B32BE|nr:HD domain-containing phosphohydrolase [Vibrio salinus]MCE0494327.1 HD domain-containing protein [Vibrio salinus]
MRTLSRKDHKRPSFWKGSLSQQLIEVLHQIQSDFPQIDRISFALYEQSTDLVKTYADSAQYCTGILRHYEHKLSSLPTLKECAENHKFRVIDNFDSDLDNTSHHNQWLIEQGLKSSLTIPTYLEEDLIGFIFINATVENYFTNDIQEKLLPFIDIIVQAATWEYETVHTIFDAANSTIQRQPRHMAQLKDHQQRMHYYTKLIATGVSHVYELSDEEIENIIIFSRFHDIGKLSIAPSVLQKCANLQKSEKDKVYDHIEKGINIVEEIISKTGCSSHACLNILKEIISYYQERLNGTGYPFGLQGEQIPVSARIIAVANIFDALTSHRPYKQACSVAYALLELEKMVSGGEIDNHCVNALRQHQQKLSDIINEYPETDPSDMEIKH